MNTTVSEQQEELQEIQVWKCTAVNCKAWTRMEYVTEELPSCPLCHSSMQLGNRQIPVAQTKPKRTFLIGKIK